MCKCTMCQSALKDDRYMQGSNNVYLCSQCMYKISIMYNQMQGNDSNIQMISNSHSNSENKEVFSLKYPKIIKKEIDQYVIGQEDAKRIMSVAVFNHLKRLALNSESGDIIEKSNILMIGPTGSGKTHIIKSLAKVCDIPFVIADATSLTETGYVGSDVESMVEALLSECCNDPERAMKGIIFIDEIDKLAQKSGSGDKRTVGCEGVQQALLKLMEGKKITLPVTMKGNETKDVTIDTSNILFICGGAFPRLEEIIKRRIGDKIEGSNNIFKHIVDEDLVEFGLIPELIGRLPVVTVLEDLSINMFKAILSEPKNSLITQYQLLFKKDNITLTFSDGALSRIAIQASEKKRGARALRTVVESILQPLMFELPGSDIKCVDISVTNDNSNYQIITK